MAPAQSTLRRTAAEQYARPFVAHYLAHRRRYSNLLMIAFSAYVLQNVGRSSGQGSRILRHPVAAELTASTRLPQTYAGLTGSASAKKKAKAAAGQPTSATPQVVQTVGGVSDETKGGAGAGGSRSRTKRRGPRVEVSESCGTPFRSLRSAAGSPLFHAQSA